MLRSLQLLLLVAPLAGMVIVVGGCDIRGSDEPSLRDGLVTRSSETGQDEMTAIVGGTLVLDADRGCILLSGKPVVWPAGTSVTPDPPEIHLANGLTARPGDSVRGGGGELPAARLREATVFIERDLNGRPRSRIDGDLTGALDCSPADSAVVVFNALGEAMTVEPAD